MSLRILGLLLCVLLGSAWGWVHQVVHWAMAGALLGALAWVVWDKLNADRFLAWLGQGAGAQAPRLSGFWAELLERSRKLVRRLEGQAQASEARLDDFLSAIQASPNGVVLLDPDNRIEWSNLTAAAHLGFDAQRDLGQYVSNLVRAPAFVAYLGGADYSVEVQIDGPGPRPTQPNKISLQLHPYGQGRLLMITRDVTAVQLAELMRRDFVANVSHEIRTPLTVLSGFVETLQTLPLDETERARYLDLMSQQAQRMRTLVSDLLMLSRLEGSPAPGEGEWVACDELLAPVLQEARGLSATLCRLPHDIVAVPLPEVEVACARSELVSAMSNLLGNAVRYTPEGGPIQAGWRRGGESGVEFFVQDSGPGIAAEHLPRLTERFYRVDHSRSRETGGTGLGLAIVKHVVQRHGAQIQISSTPGQGSCFVIRWPGARVRRSPSD
jgi:two-component system phosphate regulon sensor histidine kinase PhoR